MVLIVYNIQEAKAYISVEDNGVGIPEEVKTNFSLPWLQQKLRVKAWA